jgi:hypothetical protein
MALELNEVRTILEGIFRTIDKKAGFSAELAERDQRAVAVVDLTHRSKTTAVQIPLADVEASRVDLRRRHQVRTLLKRRFDAMRFVAPPNHMQVFAQSAAEGNQYRPSGGRGRR